MGKIKVIQPGLYTTLQDTGRFGYRKYGVPVSGAMDQDAAKIANALVMNDADEATLEITLMGPALQFEGSCLIAITGADLSPQIDEKPISRYQGVFIESGQTLTFGKPRTGCRAYLAIQGGFRAKKVLNSYSWYQPVTSKGQLGKDDELEVFSVREKPSVTNAGVVPRNITPHTLHVSIGPEYNRLPKFAQRELESREFTVSDQANRMGYRLKEPLKSAGLAAAGDMLTSSVMPGTVQLTPSGQLIILMRDGQTTGGYPRVLQLTNAAINILAQKAPGSKIRFRFT